MNYNIEEIKDKISGFVIWEKDMKENLFNEIIRLLNESKGNEIVLTVRPNGSLMNNVSAVKTGTERGKQTILYRTEKSGYDANLRVIHKNGIALTCYIDLYEAIIKNLNKYE